MIEATQQNPGNFSAAPSLFDSPAESKVTGSSRNGFPGDISSPANTTGKLSGQQETSPGSQPTDSVKLSQEAEEIRKLQSRDQEVRAHEAAHAATGGSYAGSPTYNFERGPDGQTYAVGGEVSIDVSPISGDPAGTIQKAQQVRAAALAPAQPSSQDLKVAQRAESMAAVARMELASQQAEQNKSPDINPQGKSSGDENGLGKYDDDPGMQPNNYPSKVSSISGTISRLDIHA